MVELHFARMVPSPSQSGSVCGEGAQQEESNQKIQIRLKHGYIGILEQQYDAKSALKTVGNSLWVTVT